MPVSLNAEEVANFYQGFTNEVIWPLFHDLPSLCNFDPAYWRSYLAVNEKYAAALRGRASERDFVWTHDYHLMNSLGFQTSRDRRNFLACLQALEPGARIEGRGTLQSVRLGARAVSVGSFPISIDYNAFMRRAAAPEVAAKARELHALLPKRRLVLGIDRLDYTKGITLRLKAFEHLLTHHPDMRGRVSLLQVVVPSREAIPQYERMKTEIEQLAGRINGAFARPGGWVPVWYEYRSLTRLELLAYYRAADIALITPLKDGMNLVAKEYCACSIEEDCVLILSEFAGAAEQLGGDALLVNPFDIEAVAAAIRQDVFWWVEGFLGAAFARDRVAARRRKSRC